jgi:hypothetical protein
MDYTITAIFVVVDDLLKAMREGPQEDVRRQMSDAEVATTALCAALYFGTNMERARACLHANGMIPLMLGKSRFCRRLHALRDRLEAIFLQLGARFKARSPSKRFLLDSFPVPICDNYRIPHCRIVHDEAFRGKIASKHRYFYGVKVHLVVTEKGLPVEMALLPGSASDVHGLQMLALDLPAGSELYVDAGFTSYWVEDALRELDGIDLQVCYQRTAQRRERPEIESCKKLLRRPIESTFSAIRSLFASHIHATTFNGFQLKLSLFVLAFTLNRALLMS